MTRKCLAIPDGAKVVVWHGRISIHQKGLDVLLEAWEDICQTAQVKTYGCCWWGQGKTLKNCANASGHALIRESYGSIGSCMSLRPFDAIFRPAMFMRFRQGTKVFQYHRSKPWRVDDLLLRLMSREYRIS